jgi:hypothetical protein
VALYIYHIKLSKNSVYRALYGEVVPLDTLSLSSHHH